MFQDMTPVLCLAVVALTAIVGSVAIVAILKGNQFISKIGKTGLEIQTTPNVEKPIAVGIDQTCQAATQPQAPSPGVKLGAKCSKKRLQ